MAQGLRRVLVIHRKGRACFSRHRSGYRDLWGLHQPVIWCAGGTAERRHGDLELCQQTAGDHRRLPLWEDRVVMRALLPTQQGFTLTEVLMALTLVGVTLVPLTVGMTGVVRSVRIRDDLTALSNAARGKMEEVLAMGMANIPLSNPPGSSSSLSDQVIIRGRSVQRTVIVDLADGNLPPDGIVDADFKKITVRVGAFELQSYVAATP